MRLSTRPLPCDFFPLSDRPFVVERETWEADGQGGATYAGEPLARFETWEEADIYCSHMLGNVKVYLFRKSPRGGESGDSIAHFWDGQLKWKDERAA